MTEVILRVKTKGNKIGAAMMSSLNKIGNAVDILKQVNDLVRNRKEKKLMILVSKEGQAKPQLRLLYAGDGQLIRANPEISLAQLNGERSTHGLEPISELEYRGVKKSCL
jgi:hypothetical protein